VKDLHKKLVVHGSLSPACIAIINNKDGSTVAKINCFDTAVVLDDPKSRA